MPLPQTFDYLRLGPNARHLLQGALARAADRGISVVEHQAGDYVSLSAAVGNQVAVFVHAGKLSIALDPDDAEAAAAAIECVELEKDPDNERTWYARATWEQIIRRRGDREVRALIDAAIDRSRDLGLRRAGAGTDGVEAGGSPDTHVNRTQADHP
jgi:hypothetical protein